VTVGVMENRIIEDGRIVIAARRYCCRCRCRWASTDVNGCVGGVPTSTIFLVIVKYYLLMITLDRRCH
jgi:hypothetical protein